MIAYAIDAAHRSKMFERVIVSTDDEEIAEVASRAGAEVPFKRPANLADDHTPTVPVIAHALRSCDQLGWSADWACCIYPAVPLIDASDLINAWRLLQSHGGTGYTFPVAPFPSPIQRALRRTADGQVAPFDPRDTISRTQDLEVGYFDAGQFYWGKADTWRDGASIHANGHAIVLPEWRVVDIDTPDDWDRAEIMYRAFAAD